MLIFPKFPCIVPNTNRNKHQKRRTKVLRFSGPFRCSRRYTRHESFRRIQKNEYRARNFSAVDQTAERPRKASVLVTTVSHVQRSLHQTRREIEVPTKTREKQDQRETLQSRDFCQRHSMGRLEVNCQNRGSLKEDVCKCLARTKTFLRFLTVVEETRRCCSYFMRMI